MKKNFTLRFHLLLVVAVLSSSLGFAQQCSPTNHNWGTASFGISPDPSLGQNISQGTVGQEYSQVIYLKCPTNLGNVVPGSPFSSVAIDSLRLNSVNITMGSEEVEISEIGLSLACNNAGSATNPCTFLPTNSYCGDITGLPTQSGTWPFSINVTVFFTLGGNQTIDHDFEGYSLVINPAEMIDVTFRVNMQDQTVGANGVHVAGTFNGWNTSSTVMTDANSDGIYEATVSVAAGTAISYKFLNGNDWGQDESVPSECASGNDRHYQLGSEDVALPIVCYGGCTDCAPIVEPTYVEVTFQVNMENETVSANGVHIAGSMQSWNPATSELTDDNSDGTYEITLQVEANSTVQFKFINDNNWGAGEETIPAECGTDNGNGGYNRTFEVGDADVTFGPVCFSSCENCQEVEEPTTVNVTFQVNMQNETVSANGVHIAGSMQGWNPAGSQLTDNNGDGIYEITLPVTTNSTAYFKFLNGNAWGAGIQETVPATCGVDDGNGGYNRTVEVGSANMTYGPFCFASCTNCTASEPVMVTVRVDMSLQTVDASGVFVAGSFNNWDATATQLSEYAPGQYEAIVVMNAGEANQYKFLNGNTWSGAETVPTECGENDGNGGNNRSHTAGSANEVLPVVCFSSCAACISVQMTQVTFVLNMQNETVSPLGVHLAGTFNGFSSASTPMTLQAGALYTATVSIPANTQIQFKYLNGNDFVGQETVPFECGVDDGFGGYNRNYTVGSSTVTLPQVCFSSCADCTVNVEELTKNNLQVYPNPASDRFFIQLNETVANELRIYDATGRVMQQSNINTSGVIEINTSNWSNGIYHVVIPSVGQKSIFINR